VTESNQTDWQEILTGEMLLFNLLGRIVYKYPSDEERPWLKSLIDEDVFSEVPFAAEQDETKAGLTRLQKWKKEGLSDESFTKIQADYTRLFIGPGKVLAPPWESVHFGDDRLVFQKQTLEVRDWYRRFGLESEKIHQEPDDHIGLELMFLAHTASLGVQALNEHDDIRLEETLNAQREFTQKHLGKWALTWSGLVEKNAQTDFYKGLAFLVVGALRELSAVLNIELAKGAAK
jgi:TorA maturation chaperone TorD